MSSEYIVEADNLGHVYHLYDKPGDRLKQAFLWGRRKLYRDFWAVRGVSFKLARGEALGIIGRNGSGKSTVLQMLAGVLHPSEGHCGVRGRTAALLELGSGFNPEFSGRDNVYINGAILGIGRSEIDQRFEQIVDFADIGDFIDQPVKTYSSGMVVRLAFAVQVFVDPELLIVDEALGVGDIFFQQKCFDQLRERRRRGLTLILVSHDLDAVQRVCDRALILESGKQTFLGDATEAVTRFHRPPRSGADERRTDRTESRPMARSKWSQAILSNDILGENRPAASSNADFEILAATFGDLEGSQARQCELLDELCFGVLLRARQPIAQPNVGIEIFDRFGALIYSVGMAQMGQPPPSLGRDDEIAVQFRIAMSLKPGEYTFSLEGSESTLTGNPNTAISHHRIDNLGPFVVHYDASRLMPFYGIAQLPTEVECELVGASQGEVDRP